MAKRIFKPAPAFHSRHLAPAACMCVPCSHEVLALRCKATGPTGIRCGDYKGHGTNHTILVATDFQCAEERIRLDGAR